MTPRDDCGNELVLTLNMSIEEALGSVFGNAF